MNIINKALVDEQASYSENKKPALTSNERTILLHTGDTSSRISLFVFRKMSFSRVRMRCFQHELLSLPLS